MVNTEVKIPRKCHNHKAQAFQGTKRKRDEEQTLTNMPQIKPPMYSISRTAREEPLWKGQKKNYWGLKQILTEAGLVFQHMPYDFIVCVV